MKARISQLYMAEADQLRWSNEILEPGEFVVFSPSAECSYARIKVGDGRRPLKDLDFIIDSTIAEILKQVRFEDTIDGGRITEYAK